MPNSELAKEEKIKAWKVFEQHLGTMIEPTNSPDWRITKDRKTSVIIKFSKYDEKSHNFWYGLNPDNLKQWSNYEHSFIVFLIGKHQERLVIPINRLESYISEADIKLSKGNQIKLHILFEREKYLFTEFRDFDTAEFYQNDLLESEGAGNIFIQGPSASPLKVLQSYKDSEFKNEVAGKIVSRIEDGIEFNPKNIDDAREQIYTSIAVRRGQQKFRRILIEAYEGKCAITGWDVKETLEAAHIIPYKGEHTNKLANGLLLRADIHTLFDLGLIAIDTNTMTVILVPTLVDTDYKQFNGSQLRANSDVLKVIKPALDEHLNTLFYSPKTRKVVVEAV